MNFCNNCGSKITDQSPYCPSCGSRLSENPSTVFPPADNFSQQVDRAPQQIIYNVEQDNNVTPKKKNSNNNLILIVIIAVVLVVGAAVGTYFIVSNNSESTSQHDNKDKNKDSEYEKETDEEDADDEDIDFEDEDSYGDYSYSEDYYTYDHVSIILPDGYVIDESGNIPIAKSSDYLENNCSIIFTKYDNGGLSVNDFTQDKIDDYLSNLFAGFLGINDYGTTVLDGYDAVWYIYEMEMNGVHLTGALIVVLGDTFSDIIALCNEGYDLCDELIDAADSITID